jgi:hypothetical protein
MISARIVERPALTDDELNALFSSSWDKHQSRPFSAELARSLTYLAAYQDAKLIGFVNVAWDGGSHAFLLDPTVLPPWRRQGVDRLWSRRPRKRRHHRELNGSTSVTNRRSSRFMRR